MKFGLKSSARAALVIASLLASGSVFAQATRTWVSGVGDDANPCSRTAPCKTFAGAISKTAAGGEINAIDPGGYGAVTITKSITIDGAGTMASILNAGTTGVIVNGASIRVTLRNLSINGAGTGTNGIRFLNGASLHVENVVIFNNTTFGIDAQPSASSELFVTNTTIQDNLGAAGGGVILRPSGSATLMAHFDGVRLINNTNGLRVEDRVTANFRNGFATGNTNSGLVVASTTNPAQMAVDNSLISGNGSVAATAGVKSSGAGSTAIISNNSITGNGTGILAAPGGVLRSLGNNDVSGNGVDGVPTETDPTL